jgi:hypothetical protein
MSVKTFTRVVAGSVVLGAAVLSPSIAQAKDAPTLDGTVTMAACPLTGFTDVNTASVTGASSFSVTVPATNGTEYDIRIRYSEAGSTPTAKRIFGKSRDFLVTPTTGSVFREGTITGTDVRIYRIDVVDTVNELLVYTSDGIAGCD